MGSSAQVSRGLQNCIFRNPSNRANFLDCLLEGVTIQVTKLFSAVVTIMTACWRPPPRVFSGAQTPAPGSGLTPCPWILMTTVATTSHGLQTI